MWKSRFHFYDELSWTFLDIKYGGLEVTLKKYFLKSFKNLLHFVTFLELNTTMKSISQPVF